MKSGSSDVYLTEMPGGQYTNLLFQSTCLGLEVLIFLLLLPYLHPNISNHKFLPSPPPPPTPQGQWPSVKKAYIEANTLLGDIPKVTPSSKVVGDLAQFLVSNSLSPQQFLTSAPYLSLPTSVVNFFLGHLGVPPNGFPEPLTSIVRKGQKAVEGRPGEKLEPVDFDKVLKDLKGKYGDEIEMTDVMSYVLYPEVFDAYREEVFFSFIHSFILSFSFFSSFFFSFLLLTSLLSKRSQNMETSASSLPVHSSAPWKSTKNSKSV